MKFALLVCLLLVSGCSKAYPLRLDMEKGVCSGTAVGKNLILTAAHCFKADRLKAIDGQPAIAFEIVQDGRDHALVRVDRTFKTWAIVGKRLRQGEHVWMVGNPAAEPDMYREGYVMRASDKAAWLQMAAFSGDSGAGIFDRYGRVRGVLSSISAVTLSNGWVFGAVNVYSLGFTAKDWEEIKQ